MKIGYLTTSFFCVIVIVSSNRRYTLQALNFAINTTAIFTEVEPSFLSLAIDADVIAHDFSNVPYSSPKFLALCRGLSKIDTNMIRAEIYLRIGGSKADDVIFQKTGLDLDSKTFVLNHTEWDELNMFAMKMQWKLVVGLNSLLRKEDGSWDPSNAVELIRYTQSQGYLVNYELGNEPDLYVKHRNISVPPEQLAKDFATLRAILEQETTGAPLLFGPDMATLTRYDYFSKFLANLKGGILDAITYHFYYGSSDAATLDDFINPSYLDRFLSYGLKAKSIASMFGTTKDIPLWLGETSNTYGGGNPSLSASFAAGFLWLDKLGLAARMNISVVIRQTLINGHYALLDKSLDPTPGYWISVLHKQLAGNRVLNVINSMEFNRTVQMYAHCVNQYSDQHYKKGAVTVIAINLDARNDAVFNLAGALGGLTADQYLFQANNGELTSQDMLLNGQLLKMVDDAHLPKIEPVTVKQPFRLPPLSYGFFVITDANLQICISTAH